MFTPATSMAGDTLSQSQLASVDIFLKFDCHTFSQQLVYFLCIKIIPKLPTYQFISENGLVPLSQIMHAYSPQVAHPLPYIIFDCRFPSSIPDSLSSILSKFFDGFFKPRCSKEVQNQFNSRKSVLSSVIKKSLQNLPALYKSPLAPWPIIPPKVVVMKAHPLGKFLATVSTGVYTFTLHSRDKWIAYAIAFDNHDLMSSSLTEYLKFCSLFRFIPQTNDMVSMRIYVELFSLLAGMEYGSLKKKKPGHSYQHIIDEISDLRRVKFLNPMINISGRYLLALMLQSPK